MSELWLKSSLSAKRFSTQRRENMSNSKVPQIIIEELKLIESLTAIAKKNFKKYKPPKDSSLQEDLQEISKILILIIYKQESYKGKD